MSRRVVDVIIPVAAVVALHVACAAIAFPTFAHDFDTPHYARIAAEISAGQYRASPHPFSNRFGVTVPAAALYLIGHSPLTTALWPIVASSTSVGALYCLVRVMSGSAAAFVAAVLLATNPTQTLLSVKLLPDVIVSLFMLLVASFLWRGRRFSRWAALSGVLCGASLAAAGAAKESVVWLAPLLLWLLFKDRFGARHRAFWVALLATAVVALGIFLVGYQIGTGDPLFRLAGIEATHNVRNWSYQDKSFSDLMARLTFEPAVMIASNSGYATLVLLASSVLLGGTALLRSREVKFLAGYAAAITGCLWFGTTSLQFYNPLQLFPRFLLPALPPLAALAGIGLADMTRWRRARLGSWTAVALVVMAAAGGILVTYRRSEVGVHPVLELDREVLDDAWEDGNAEGIVFADRHSVFWLPIVLEEEIPKGIRFLEWGGSVAELARVAAGSGEGSYWVYVHDPRLKATELNWDFVVPDFARNAPRTWRIVGAKTVDGEHWVRLYRVGGLEGMGAAEHVDQRR